MIPLIELGCELQEFVIPARGIALIKFSIRRWIWRCGNRHVLSSSNVAPPSTQKAGTKKVIT